MKGIKILMGLSLLLITECLYGLGLNDFTLRRIRKEEVIVVGEGFYPLPEGKWEWRDENYLFYLKKSDKGKVTFTTEWTTYIRDPDDSIPFSHRLELVARDKNTKIMLYEEDLEGTMRKVDREYELVNKNGFHLLGFVLQKDTIPFQTEKIPHLYLMVTDEFFEAIVAKEKEEGSRLKTVMEIYDDYDTGRIERKRILEFITISEARRKGIIK
ncbi:MAG: hypothetical protein NC821_02020 [Candidatus Omnitrophica bacterium]|nr:hypothetical protein [Candidatus Omnitrophota bacterium]